jgi:hypothetical protein
MMKIFLSLLWLLLLGLAQKFIFVPALKTFESSFPANIFLIIILFIIGVYLIFSTAQIIEHTTGVLKNRTGLAGGLLQALGTAFPDMVIGVVSALLSLQAAATDPLKAINLAIVAAATTFGSNIYNTLHAAWCLFRQNRANHLDKNLSLFPIIGGGTVYSFKNHEVLPPKKDIENALQILIWLTLITSMTAIFMVLFGKIKQTVAGFSGDLYQLTPMVGIFILLICAGVLFSFRKSHQEDFFHDEKTRIFDKFPTVIILAQLVVAGAVILFAAEGIIEGVMVFSAITKIPYMITGVITALIGCLGEMAVIHNFTVHPKGRLADAVTGVAIDNIVTTMGASFIAILGGIFLGSDALIIIFILILLTNTFLMREIAELKNTF